MAEIDTPIGPGSPTQPYAKVNLAALESLMKKSFAVKDMPFQTGLGFMIYSSGLAQGLFQSAVLVL